MKFCTKTELHPLLSAVVGYFSPVQMNKILQAFQNNYLDMQT